MESQSGVGAGIDTLLHVQRRMSALDVHTLLRPETIALYEAMAEVATIGSPEARRLGEAVVEGCGQVMLAATRRGEARSPLSTRVQGEKWTDDQIVWRETAEHELTRARAEFTALARKELGVSVGDPVLPQVHEA